MRLSMDYFLQITRHRPHCHEMGELWGLLSDLSGVAFAFLNVVSSSLHNASDSLPIAAIERSHDVCSHNNAYSYDFAFN